MSLEPPKLRNDCFAMPQGVDWVPVDEALSRLRASLHPVVATETMPVALATGRILAKDAVALRSNPPAANAAVDGYGFCPCDACRGRKYVTRLLQGVRRRVSPLAAPCPMAMPCAS